MFAEKFSPLIKSNKIDAAALTRLSFYFSEFEKMQGEKIFKIRLGTDRIFDIAQPGSIDRLTRIISLLIKERIIERRIIVRFPSGAGQDFKSYTDIPDVVRDPIDDVNFTVTVDVLEPIYIPVQ